MSRLREAIRQPPATRTDALPPVRRGDPPGRPGGYSPVSVHPEQAAEGCVSRDGAADFPQVSPLATREYVAY